jgi:MOSC domain-containing protein YiiM
MPRRLAQKPNESDSAMNSIANFTIKIDQIRVGSIQSFGPNHEPSAIEKSSVLAPVALTKTGFAKDQQADKQFHGGLEKAIHHFPKEHYTRLQVLFPKLSLTVGAFGENLSTVGLNEKNVCVGDIFQFGQARLQVTQARLPCWKLNYRHASDRLAQTLQAEGMTGWYYRVLTEGVVSTDDTLVLIDRPYPEAMLHDVLDLLFKPVLQAGDTKKIERLLLNKCLSASWQQRRSQRLQDDVTDGESKRFQIPARQI